MDEIEDEMKHLCILGIALRDSCGVFEPVNAPELMPFNVFIIV